MVLPPNSKSKPDLPQKPPLLSTPTSADKQQSQGGTGFSRSFGVYFPRASAQVQPRSLDVDELLRVIEDLREKESRLKTELLEQKLLKESVAIVPVLENEISSKDLVIGRSKAKIECLESENERLRGENEFLHMELAKQNQKYTEKIKCMQAELADIKIAVVESQREQEEEASSSIAAKFIDAINSCKSCVPGKLLRKCAIQNHVSGHLFESGMSVHANHEAEIVKKDEFLGVVEEESSERPRLSWCNAEEIPETPDGLIMGSRSRAPRVPKPPPRPSAALLSSLPSTATSAVSSSVSSPSCRSLSDSGNRALPEISYIRPPPPPPPPRKVKAPTAPAPPPLRYNTVPPPPPPPPASGLKKLPEKVRRIPEVVEFYHSLMRRESNTRRDAGGSSADGLAAGATKDMIGEIENRSAHLLAIKTDVETQGDFIKFLIKEVEYAEFADIEDVVPFVKWLDDELSYLVDERAVLKHFDWPEQKADALREAAFGYCDLKKMESEASSFHDAPRQPCFHALKKMQSLFDKLEHGVYNLSRVRESATKRYKVFHIPVNWMLDTGFVIQIKLASVKLAMMYMKRVLAELGLIGGVGSPEDEELIVQGVKFAFRVHQFAGGFDVETMKTFQELRDKARSCNIQCHNQHQQKLVCRSSSAAF